MRIPVRRDGDEVELHVGGAAGDLGQRAGEVGGHEHRTLEDADQDDRAPRVVARDPGGHPPNRRVELVGIAAHDAKSAAIRAREYGCCAFAESDELLAEMRQEAHEIVRELLAEDIREVKLLQEHIHDGLGQLVYDRTHRRPMILPVVVEV